MDGTCDVPRCRQSDDYRYIGKDLCEKHFEQLCKAYEKGREAENKFLARIQLHRNENGSVVPQ